MGDLIILSSLDHDCCYFLHLEIQGVSFPWQVNWQRDHNLPRSAGYVFMSDGCRTLYACGFDFFFFSSWAIKTCVPGLNLGVIAK